MKGPQHYNPWYHLEDTDPLFSLPQYRNQEVSHPSPYCSNIERTKPELDIEQINSNLYIRNISLLSFSIGILAGMLCSLLCVVSVVVLLKFL